jgi:small subunit ribosomal protein S23
VGDSVVQRQAWLMREEELSEPAAYDKARTEYYNHKHSAEVEKRVAKEEAMAYGAFFGPGALEIGMQLEDQQYENWKEWAIKESNALKQLQSSAYGEGEAPEDPTAPALA